MPSLYCSDHVPRIMFGLSVLKNLGGGGLDKQSFLMKESNVEQILLFAFQSLCISDQIVGLF